VDAMNFRVQVLDKNGEFQYAIGKIGDDVGTMFRPKGVAFDSEGHLYVVDGTWSAVQVFNREGQLLTYIGDVHASGLGQFKALVGIAIDKQNRVFTTEQYPGRMQMFRYVTDAEAAVEKAKREEDLKKAADARRGVASNNSAPKPADTPAPKPEAAAPVQKPADAPAQKPVTAPPS